MAAERSDGRRGEPGGLNDFGARERACLIDGEREHAIEIQLAEVGGVTSADVRIALKTVMPGRAPGVNRHAFENSL